MKQYSPRLWMFLLVVAFPQWGSTAETGGNVVIQSVNGGLPVAFRLTVPSQPIDINEVHAQLPSHPWAQAFHKSKVWAADSYDEWARHVSEDYKAKVMPDRKGFSEAKRVGLARRAAGTAPNGKVVYWLEAEAGGIQMLYVVQHVRVAPDAQFGNSIKMFVKENGRWVSHSKDDLEIVNQLPIANLEALTERLKQKQHEGASE